MLRMGDWWSHLHRATKDFVDVSIVKRQTSEPSALENIN